METVRVLDSIADHLRGPDARVGQRQPAADSPLWIELVADCSGRDALVQSRIGRAPGIAVDRSDCMDFHVGPPFQVGARPVRSSKIEPVPAFGVSPP